MGKPTGFLDYERVEARAASPKERIKNFNEFHTPLSEEEQRKQSARCMDCGVPFCQSGMTIKGMTSGCPLNNLIPEWNDLLYTGNWEQAYNRLHKTSNFPEFTSRVCPALCEKACTCGLDGKAVCTKENEMAIIEYAYAHGYAKANPPKLRTKKRIAVVGSGPAGLTCAGDLAKMGYDVTIFEALHEAGGVLVYGIPEFRLPKQKVVAAEVENVEALGVKIELDSVAGRLYTVDELMEEEGFDAVFIGTGAGLPRFQGIPGESFNGVYSANEFLTRCNLMKAYKFPEHATPIQVGRHVAVVGGGNVAMDAARTALRLGAEKVSIIYRRSEAEIPARAEEVEHAKEEGIDFQLLTNPVEVLGDENGWVKGLRCIRMELGEPDASGRRRPIPIEGSEFDMEMDTVIIAIGTGPNPIIAHTTPGLKTTKRGNIEADEETCATSKEGVFAGGDIVTGAATVILAMGAGRKAAAAIDEYLKSKRK